MQDLFTIKMIKKFC